MTTTEEFPMTDLAGQDVDGYNKTNTDEETDTLTPTDDSTSDPVDGTDLSDGSPMHSNLIIANFLVGMLQLLTWIAILTLTMTMTRHATIPWYSNFASTRPDYVTVFEWLPVAKRWKNVQIGHFAAIFILLSAIYHLAVGSVANKRYFYDLRRCRNSLRWFEYSISASVMHVHVAMLCGMFDIHALTMVFGLSVCSIVFGYLTDPPASTQENDEYKPDTRAFYLGFVPFAFMWMNIFCYFFYAIKHATGVPDWIWSIILIIFALDMTFAINMFLVVKRVGWWKSYVWGEICFILLSLTSKQLLAWINFYGTMNVPDH